MQVGAASDQALVSRARAGSRDAAGELFSRHWSGAWRAAFALTGRRSLADDVTQDAFERAFAALSRFDDRRPFAPWLHRIVVNRALDLLRQEWRLVGLDGAPEIVGEADDGGLADREMLAAVSGLSRERRAVIVLRYGIGYTPTEIADLLRLPVGTVNSRLARALEDLRHEVGVTGVERP